MTVKPLMEGANGGNADGAGGTGDPAGGAGAAAGAAEGGAAGGDGEQGAAGAADGAAGGDLAGGGDEPGAGGDGDKLTQEEWETKFRADAPPSADAYELPDIEGLDKDVAATSPIMTTMREAAFKAGLSQDKFKEVVEGYVKAEGEKAEATYNAEMAKLGADEATAKRRIDAVAGFVTRNLPENEAKALIASVTTADGLKALERLMNRNPASGGGEPPVQQDSWETIQSLMNSDAYMGNDGVRDPAVVARVDRYFQSGGKRGGKG